MYKLGQKTEKKKRRGFGWIIFFIFLLGILGFSVYYFLNHAQPATTIHQASAKVTTIGGVQQVKTTKYTEPDFTIQLPVAWQAQPSPTGPYKTFNWSYVGSSKDGEEITVYEDTIPANFAVNRVLVVTANGSSLTVGSVSDNCNSFTTNTATNSSEVGDLAKWQGVEFYCDQNNTERDVIGTSSAGAINTVSLNSPTTGKTHKFLFTYTDHSLSPDYSTLTNALSSFEMQ